VSGDGKRARVAGYVCGEIDLRFFLVVRKVEIEQETERWKCSSKRSKRQEDDDVV
jgi:hypothetical protein